MTKKTRKKAYVPVTQQLREIIAQCGVTRYRIAQETNISEQTLSKFMSGHQKGLSPDALDELGEYLGISLVVEGSANKGQR